MLGASARVEAENPPKATFLQRLCGAIFGHDVVYVCKDWSEHGVGVLVHDKCGICGFAVKYVAVERNPIGCVTVR